MIADAFELVLGTLGSEIGDLWLECADEVGRGIDDLDTKPFDAVAGSVEWGRKAGGIRIKPNAQLGPAEIPGGSESVVKTSHVRR